MTSTTIIPISSFSNSYIIKGDKAVIVDGGLPGQEKKIFAALEANRIPLENVSLIVITHGHGDHYGSLKALKDALKVPVMAGWPDNGYIEKGTSAPRVPVNLMGRLIQPFTGFGVDPCNVELVVKEDTSLDAYGVDARVLMTPGHTKGSISILASGSGCMVGDLLAGLVFKNSIGATPLAEVPEMIGPSLKKIFDVGTNYIFPGHGNRWDASAVRKKFFGIIK